MQGISRENKNSLECFSVRGRWKEKMHYLGAICDKPSIGSIPERNDWLLNEGTFDFNRSCPCPCFWNQSTRGASQLNKGRKVHPLRLKTQPHRHSPWHRKRNGGKKSVKKISQRNMPPCMLHCKETLWQCEGGWVVWSDLPSFDPCWKVHNPWGCRTLHSGECITKLSIGINGAN